MARNVVLQQDAVVAITLVEACSDTSSQFCSQNALHTVCPDNADAELRKDEERILASLSAGDKDF